MTAPQLSFLDGQSESGRVTLRSFDTPQERKAEGMQRSWDNAAEWRDEALQCVREYLLTLPDGTEVCGDDWREAIPIEPHHHNAYGALAGVIARYGWLVWTGGYTTSRQAQGHQNVVKRWTVNRAAVLRGKPEKAQNVRKAA